ncbi:tumor necrosis factor receptor superfamily member 5 isoform X1 [Sapajus apella]|uniref:Tumor necrosis factor receptor superfamily member 5 n=1 Tax=Sapajus apella TaxID=9515 RepID=A0A6J3GNK5_SAPAP|nr:tumor necrosis factor receptor superfamily member 5 isoform X1 [Sapajus apella]
MFRLPLQCVFWGCLLTSVHPEPPTACREKQYLINSQCCTLCQPGQKLVNDCTEFTETQCLPCGKGEFLDTWNRETHCHQHKYCDPNLGLRVQQEGTSVTDNICVCKEGRHCTSKACESCVLHHSCSPGFGVKQIATGVSDTICEPCPVGSFSNVSSAFEKCRPWTRCETKGLAEQQAGTDKTDAVCGPQNRLRLLVMIPIILGILFTILLLLVFIKKVDRKPQDEAPCTKQIPQEIDDLPGPNPTPPVQETLHGCQPVAQEDGKESRISVQERQ